MQVDRLDLNDEIAAIVGQSGVIAAPDPDSAYCRDWSGDHRGVPRLVVRPRSTAEVSAVVGICQRARIKMTPQGGHTGLVGGATPSPHRDEVVINLERMNAIRELDPINFSMVVEAGCVVEAARAGAQSIDCQFPLSIGSQGSCQIGGVVSTNAGGMNVLRFGMTRDLVLGVEAVLPDGRIWNGLKKLRKDNTGYDLKQLFIGGEGTLGIVTAACVKLFPQPTQTVTALIGFETVAKLLSTFAKARRDLCDLLSAFELLTEAGLADALEVMPDLRRPLASRSPYYVILEASASGPIDLGGLVETFLADLLTSGVIVDAALASGGTQAASFWRLREGAIEAQRRSGRHLRTDVSTPISALESFLEDVVAGVSAVDPKAQVRAHGHVGDGNIHVNVMPPAGLSDEAAIEVLRRCETAIHAIADRFEGSISAEHGIGRSLRDAHAERTAAAEREIAKKLKLAFDPNNLMNDGRILSAG